MLELKNIKKSYKTGDFVQHALCGINLKFRKNEFVSILGPSGSGKTTLLNIIGGLDRYDSGDLIINNKSTKKFKDINWDFYRNNCIGFIFQSYNLISHINILENVELSTTLSGYKKSKRRKLAMEALEKVGLKNHMYKKPNQLSGGQMQRVAIARALVNDPDIILADEPTGALDTKTSKQIMDLIKEISKDKLVIMVTHNPDLAHTYSNRIIEFMDGEVVGDTNPYNEEEKIETLKIKKTKMSYMSAINLSFKNLKTKFGRTFITAFASSIGIIGIALILSLSNGFKIKIDEFEKNALSQAPVLIQEQTVDTSSMGKVKEDDLKEYSNVKKVYALKASDTPAAIHINKINEDYIDYLDKLDKDLLSGIQYGYKTNINALIKNDKVSLINFSSIATTLPRSDSEVSEVISNNFDVIEGELTTDMNSIYLLVDSKNRVSEDILKILGFDGEVSFKDIIDKEIKVVLNNDYYKEVDQLFIPNTNYDELYNKESNITLKIKGIIRGKKDNEFSLFSGTGVLYNDSLIDYIVDNNSKSDIVIKQINSNTNLLTNQETNEEEKTTVLSYLGANKIPMSINIFPKDFNSKEKLVKYLDKYNKGLKEEDKILYLDQAKLITSLSGGIMDAITIVLIAFSSISLVVSSIMVGIITYTSVLERTKEIGILRAIGARRKDITRVFNAETLIIGLFSGILGIVITKLLIIPINNIIYSLTKLEKVANLNPIHAIILIIISVTLTLIGGFIPAKIASKKDPVIALRTE